LNGARRSGKVDCGQQDYGDSASPQFYAALAEQERRTLPIERGPDAQMVFEMLRPDPFAGGAAGHVVGALGLGRLGVSPG
jgi:hypothetical protein